MTKIKNGETSKQQISLEMRKKLRAPFPDEAIKPHEQKPYLSTIKAIYIVERLNDVFGIGRWDLCHEIIKETDTYILMKGQLHFFDYDCYFPYQYGGHITVQVGTEMADGYKSAVTDILSKCASYLEIGIDVFKGKIVFKGNVTLSSKKKKQWQTLGEPTNATAEKSNSNDLEPAKSIAIYPSQIDKIMKLLDNASIKQERFEQLLKTGTWKTESINDLTTNQASVIINNWPALIKEYDKMNIGE